MKTEWNLELLYKDINDPQIERDIELNEKAVVEFINKWKSNKEYLKDPQVLRVALDEYEKLLSEFGVLYKPAYYIFLQRNLNQESSEFKAKENKLNEIELRLDNELQFFVLNLSKIPKGNQSVFLKDNGLEEYHHFLESLFKVSKYWLSDKEEKVFNLKGKTSHSNWVSMVEELLSKQMLTVLDENDKKIEVPYNEVSKYLSSTKKKVRDYAAKEFLKVNQKYAEIAEFEINSVLENKKLSDDYRKVPRPDTSRHLSDDMDTETVDTLVEVVTENFDIPQRFYKLKADFLKQKQLAYYERNVPFQAEKEKEYSYEKAFEIVKSSFNNLDPEFGEYVDSFLTNGQYDVFPKKGKSGGAFCIKYGQKNPTYILLNFKNRVEDILTIAHESGHGIHSEYSTVQNSLNSGHSTATAEVASTFFEDFTLSEVLKDADEDLKRALMFKRLEDSVQTVFRQIACYNFETRLHSSFKEKGYLSLKDVSDIFSEEMCRYCGEFVKQDDHMRNGWLYWDHIRRFFYVYTYSSGLLISKSLQALVREDPKSIEGVKTFFRAGTSKSPRDIFLDMGIDISKKEFWEKGIKEMRDQLEYLESISSPTALKG